MFTPGNVISKVQCITSSLAFVVERYVGLNGESQFIAAFNWLSLITIESLLRLDPEILQLKRQPLFVQLLVQIMEQEL